jgi:tetratricopeptide (TPR) repeat protein
MILTKCAVCATDLGLSLGKKCGRCSTRYCGPECQKKHWEEGGHDQLCKKIKKAGGAEQYNANKRYKESVAVAAEACAEDTKGQTCYICTQAIHWKTKEGLVRGCACRGTAGFAHVSCLAEQAKILREEAEENNLSDKLNERWDRWYTCSLCEQQYHGVVRYALGWACWKAYVGRPETDEARLGAISALGNGLSIVGHHEDALSVREAQLFLVRRIGGSEHNILGMLTNLSSTYFALGRLDETMRLRQEVYSGYLKHYGEEHKHSLGAAYNLATCLRNLERFEEAKSLLRKMMPVARRVLGESHDLTLKMRWHDAWALYVDTGATLNDRREAATTLEDITQTARRVFGAANPTTVSFEESLRDARAALDALAAREAQDPLPVNSSTVGTSYKSTRGRDSRTGTCTARGGHHTFASKSGAFRATRP